MREEFLTRNISRKSTEDIARLLFPNWDEDRLMTWMGEKGITFLR